MACLITWTGAASELWPTYAPVLLGKTLAGISKKGKIIHLQPQDQTSALFDDGQLFATLDDSDVDATLKLWDTQMATVRYELKRQSIGRPLMVSPDGKSIATLCQARIAIWDFPTSRIRVKLNHEIADWSGKFSQDGRVFATVHSNPQKKAMDVKLWDAATGVQTAAFPDLVPAHRLVGLGSIELSSSAFQLSPDGRYLAFADVDWASPVLFDSMSRENRALLPLNKGPALNELRFSPDGRTLATINWVKALRLWDVESGRQRALYESPGRIQMIAFSPDSKRIAVSYDCDSSKTRICERVLGDKLASWLFPWEEHTLILDVDSGQPLAKLPFSEHLAFRPDGRTLVLYSAKDDAIHFWEIKRHVRWLASLGMFATALVLSVWWWRAVRIPSPQKTDHQAFRPPTAETRQDAIPPNM